jgi:molybdopterin converting factor small subunit
MNESNPGNPQIEKNHISVDVALYGSIAKYGGGKHVAQIKVNLDDSACMADLLEYLKIPPEERGFTFINAVLSAMPGVQVDLDQPLNSGDHIGIFSITHMWPYQYRDGVRMTEALTEALKKQGPMHHSYR